jgi:hypothetical protein
MDILKSDKSKDGAKVSLLPVYAALAVLGFLVYSVSTKTDTVVQAYQMMYAENNTARTNIKALGQTKCWECHGKTWTFLPRRQYLSEEAFVKFVRDKASRNNSDQGKMPEYTGTDISDEDLKRMYILLYSTIRR